MKHTPPQRYEPPPMLGPCCVCRKPGRHANVMCLDFEAPAGFKGWGCIICNKPQRGAVAVYCNACVDTKQPADAVDICGGTYVTDKVRVPLEGYVRVPFSHDEKLHELYEGPPHGQH